LYTFYTLQKTIPEPKIPICSLPKNELNEEKKESTTESPCEKVKLSIPFELDASEFCAPSLQKKPISIVLNAIYPEGKKQTADLPNAEKKENIENLYPCTMQSNPTCQTAANNFLFIPSINFNQKGNNPLPSIMEENLLWDENPPVALPKHHLFNTHFAHDYLNHPLSQQFNNWDLHDNQLKSLLEKTYIKEKNCLDILQRNDLGEFLPCFLYLCDYIIRNYSLKLDSIYDFIRNKKLNSIWTHTDSKILIKILPNFSKENTYYDVFKIFYRQTKMFLFFDQKIQELEMEWKNLIFPSFPQFEKQLFKQFLLIEMEDQAHCNIARMNQNNNITTYQCSIIHRKTFTEFEFTVRYENKHISFSHRHFPILPSCL
jgi:hypothetical protein